MTRYYKGKYRAESSRLSGWDYRSAAHYFITICAKGHRCCLATILDGVAYVSPLGLMLPRNGGAHHTYGRMSHSMRTD